MRVSKPLFLLLAMLVSPAIGAVSGVSTRGVATVNSERADADVAARGATSRANSSRGQSNVSSRGDATATRGTTGRTVASRSTSTDTGRGTTSRTTTARTTSSNVVSATRSTQDANSNPAVRRAGVVVRPAVADFGGRATIAGTDKQTGSNIRGDIQRLTNRAAEVSVSKDTIDVTKENLDKIAEINTSCQEQYNECMDQFCAVVDTNQKRCSCSANLSKYAKVEAAANEANQKLNEVAQTIRYVGLSADEIRAIMNETEAEEALSGNKDTSTTRNMLEQIEKMIKDPTSSKSSYTVESNWGFGLDMDLDFTADSSDIFNLDFLNTNRSASSISNMRGTELYNAAKKRCNTILTKCKSAGATIDQVTGNYDLAIDRDCIAYEAGLKKMNSTLVSNVNNAKLLLQKARLAVMENKNQYDARGCLGALENCMRDDMVCGDDYSRCIDPTKSYIDENGDVVLGQDITQIQSFMVNYSNADISADYLSSAYDSTTTKCAENGDGSCIVRYLLQKIGTKQKATDEGLCRPVLDKCQLYTYKDGKYQPYNDVVVNYIQRAMVNIKSAQQQIIADYASTCMTDVASCYSQQVSQVNSWSSAASTKSAYSIMRGACRGVALTCGLAIFSGYPKIEEHQQISIGDATYNVSGCHINSANEVTYNDDIVECVSSIFYQSLLCPDNSTYIGDAGADTEANGTLEGMVNNACRCNSGYRVFSGQCIACPDGAKLNSVGSCVCTVPGYSLSGGVCKDKDGEVYTMDGTPEEAAACTAQYPNSVPAKSSCLTANEDGTSKGCVAEGCRCQNGFMSVNRHCVPTCSVGTYRANCTGAGSGKGGCVAQYCACASDEYVSNGTCVSLACNGTGMESDNNASEQAANDGTAGGHLKPYCKCGSDYVVSGTSCTAKTAYCPTNATYESGVSKDEEGTLQGGVKANCRCNTGYVVSGTSCVSKQTYCPDNSSFSEGKSVDTDGTDKGGVKKNCACDDGFVVSNNGCVAKTSYCTGGSSYVTSGCSGPSEGTASTRGCIAKYCQCPDTARYAIGGSCTPNPCPEHANYKSSCNPVGEGQAGCVNERCECETGYVVGRGGSTCITTAEWCGTSSTHAQYDATTCTTGADSYDGKKNGCASKYCACTSNYEYLSLGDNGNMCVYDAATAIMANLAAVNPALGPLRNQSSTPSQAVISTVDDLCLQYSVDNTGYHYQYMVACP